MLALFVENLDTNRDNALYFWSIGSSRVATKEARTNGSLADRTVVKGILIFLLFFIKFPGYIDLIMLSLVLY